MPKNQVKIATIKTLHPPTGGCIGATRILLPRFGFSSVHLESYKKFLDEGIRTFAEVSPIADFTGKTGTSMDNMLLENQIYS